MKMHFAKIHGRHLTSRDLITRAEKKLSCHICGTETEHSKTALQLHLVSHDLTLEAYLRHEAIY